MTEQQLSRSRRRFRLTFSGLLVGLGFLGSASPVSAHADLVVSNPSASAVLEQGPKEISLRFTEPVTPVDRSVEVFNQQGQLIQIGDAIIDPSDATAVVVQDLPELPLGQYVVAWRVLSADGHVAQGAFSFQIGTQQSSQSGADIVADVLAGLATSREGPPGLDAVRYGARFAVFVGLAALMGTLLFAVASQLGGRRIRLAIIAGWWAATLGTALHFLTQGPYAVGGSWTGVVDPDLWADVWSTRNGQALVVRLVLLVLFAGLLILAHRNRQRIQTSWWRSSSALVGAGVIVTMSAAGHPSSSSLAGVSVAVDAVHLAAIVLWIGGLVAVILVGSTTSDPDVVMQRFSRWATVAVPIAVVTGMWQTWHLISRWDDLSNTAWGRALVVKVSFVVAAVTVGGIARWVVVNRLTGSIRRLIVIEVAVVVAILAATSALVSHPPRVQAETKVFNASLVEGTTIANVTVTPGRIGVNEIHVTVQTPSGALAPVAGVTMRFTLDGSDIPALAVPVEVLGPNHFTGSVSLLNGGSWTLEIIVQVDAATVTRLTTTVDIAG